MTRAGPVQLERGTKVPPQEVLAISGERLRIPDSERLVHLQFRRYALPGLQSPSEEDRPKAR